VDFTNPAAAAWYRAKLTDQLDLGADSFKPDFAEEIPADAVFANGLTGTEMHNPYPLLFQKEVFAATRARADRVVAWSRSPGPARAGGRRGGRARRRGFSASRAPGRATRSARSSISPTPCAAASPRP